MRNFYRFLLPLLIAIVAFSGCRKKPNPMPRDTRFEKHSSDRPDYVSDIEIYGQPQDLEGLELVDEESFVMEGDRIEGMFSPVYFDFNQSAVRSEERGKLGGVAQHLAAAPADNLLLEGHCDWRGTVEYNLALGDRRAESVKQYLITLGVEVERIEIVSKGDLEALTDGTEDQMQQDRRADLIIVRN